MRYHGFLYLAFVLALMCMACGCGREQSVDTPEGYTVKTGDGAVTVAGNEEAGRITITTDEGEDFAVSYTTNKLADGFPEDVPIYDPAQISMSQVFNAGRNAVVTLTTPHSPERVVDYYRRELAGQGWAVGGEMSVGGMVMLQGKKGGFDLHFTALPVEGHTKINLAKTEADE